jgi:hypothetical protein
LFVFGAACGARFDRARVAAHTAIANDVTFRGASAQSVVTGSTPAQCDKGTLAQRSVIITGAQRDTISRYAQRERLPSSVLERRKPKNGVVAAPLNRSAAETETAGLRACDKVTAVNGCACA